MKFIWTTGSFQKEARLQSLLVVNPYSVLYNIYYDRGNKRSDTAAKCLLYEQLDLIAPERMAQRIYDKGQQVEPLVQHCWPAASCHHVDEILIHHHSSSTLLKDEQDVLIRPIAPPSLLKVTDAGAAHPVRICRVVVEDRAIGPVEATNDHKVTLVLWLSAETLLANRQEAAVFDRRGAVFTS